MNKYTRDELIQVFMGNFSNIVMKVKAQCILRPQEKTNTGGSDSFCLKKKKRPLLEHQEGIYIVKI